MRVVLDSSLLKGHLIFLKALMYRGDNVKAFTVLQGHMPILGGTEQILYLIISRYLGKPIQRLDWLAKNL